MSFRKSTRYALYAAMEMARAGKGEQVTATQVAEHYSIPSSVLAKVFQQLVRAGVAVGTRGSGGGYCLAKSPSEVTVLNILEVFEPARPSRQCLLSEVDEKPCLDFSVCRLGRLVEEVEEQARATYASVSLETLVGLKPPQEDVLFRVLK